MNKNSSPVSQGSGGSRGDDAKGTAQKEDLLHDLDMKDTDDAGRKNDDDDKNDDKSEMEKKEPAMRNQA